MRRRRIPSDSEITAWDTELRAVLPNFRCNAFEFVSKARKPSESGEITPYRGKNSLSELEFDGKLPENNTIGDAIIHYHTPIITPEKSEYAENLLPSDMVTNKSAYIKTLTGGNSISSKILEKMPHKFKDAISDINKLLCIASQSVSYIPLGGVFTPDLAFPLKLLGRKRSKIILSSDTDDYGGYILKNDFFQDQLSPSNLQDDYFNVCHTLNQLSQEYSSEAQEKATCKSDFYTYQIVDEKIPKTTSVGKMPSINHRLKCATNTINTLNKWHNVRITLDKNIRKYINNEDPEGFLALNALQGELEEGLPSTNAPSMAQKTINPSIKEKRSRRREDWSDVNRIRYIGVSEFCSLVSNVIRQVESNLETISQMSKCPTLLDDPRMYIKQSLNASIPNFSFLANASCSLERNIKIKSDNTNTSNVNTSNVNTSDQNTTNPNTTNVNTSNVNTSNVNTSNVNNSNVNNSKVNAETLSESDNPMGNYRMPISSLYSVNNSLYDHVNSSRFIPKIPVLLKEPIINGLDTSYSTRFKNISTSNSKIAPSNLNGLCSSGLVALINQAQYTLDPDELASIILSAMMINHKQPSDEPKFIDKDTNAKCHKVKYVNGIVSLYDDNTEPSIGTIDSNQLLVQHQAQAVAKLKLALSYCTTGNKMTIRGQIGIKISMLINEVLKMSQHRTKLLTILDKLKHLDKRAMEIVSESEKLHKALYYYYQSLVDSSNSNSGDFDTCHFSTLNANNSLNASNSINANNSLNATNSLNANNEKILHVRNFDEKGATNEKATNEKKAINEAPNVKQNCNLDGIDSATTDTSPHDNVNNTNNRNSGNNSCNRRKRLEKLPPNYVEELLNLEMLHFVCETIMETKIKLTEQIISFLDKQCAILDRIIPENLCKAIEIILNGKEKNS